MIPTQHFVTANLGATAGLRMTTSTYNPQLSNLYVKPAPAPVTHQVAQIVFSSNGNVPQPTPLIEKIQFLHDFLAESIANETDQRIKERFRTLLEVILTQLGK